ncbi:hypothetical protein [Oceanobacillus massiliensis]|uniref:hypothetical protein n=1 Tax=Oceanobacillus massiliensis TaxID=1465765 RepID=UPI000304FDA9|nr:hypothetical protein [Oceanobacillus massiliensis]
MFKPTIATTFTIIILPIGIMIESLIGKYWNISTWKLADYSVQLMAETGNEYYVETLLLTIALTVLAIIIGILLMWKNSGTTKI